MEYTDYQLQLQNCRNFGILCYKRPHLLSIQYKQFRLLQETHWSDNQNILYSGFKKKQSRLCKSNQLNIETRGFKLQWISQEPYTLSLAIWPVWHGWQVSWTRIELPEHTWHWSEPSGAVMGIAPGPHATHWKPDTLGIEFIGQVAHTRWSSTILMYSDGLHLWGSVLLFFDRPRYRDWWPKKFKRLWNVLEV